MDRNQIETVYAALKARLSREEWDHFVNEVERLHKAILEGQERMGSVRIFVKPEVCDFCQGTGQHLSPDVAEPILIKCSKKGCTANG